MGASFFFFYLCFLSNHLRSASKNNTAGIESNKPKEIGRIWCSQKDNLNSSASQSGRVIIIIIKNLLQCVKTFCIRVVKTITTIITAIVILNRFMPAISSTVLVI